MKIVSDGKTLGVPSCASQDIYSLEEQVIGRWIDGKPLYRKTLIGTVPNNADNAIFLTTENDKEVYNLYGMSFSDVGSIPINSSDTSTRTIQVYYKNGDIYVSCGVMFYGATIYFSIEYTKTTDQATVELPAALDASATSRILTSAVNPQTSGIVDVDGAAYDYSLPSHLYASASAPATAAPASFAGAPRSAATVTLDAGMKTEEV